MTLLAVTYYTTEIIEIILITIINFQTTLPKTIKTAVKAQLVFPIQVTVIASFWYGGSWYHSLDNRIAVDTLSLAFNSSLRLKVL